MSTNPPASIAKAHLSTALISGRLEFARTIQTQQGPLKLSLIKLPAPDEFSQPQTIEVQSVRGLGQKGDIIEVRVTLGGRARSFDATDEAGDKRKVYTATNTLTAVEA